MRSAFRALTIAIAVFWLPACDEAERPVEQRVLGGNSELGREIVMRVGCGACHKIPSLPSADGVVGPSLEDFAHRALIAGIVPNRPGTLVRWVREAPAIAPNTGMPNMPVTEDEARHVAAFLYTLR